MSLLPQRVVCLPPPPQRVVCLVFGPSAVLCLNRRMPLATTDRLRELESDATTLAPEALMQRICERLAQLPNFNWVGFYMLAEEGGEKVLHLGPFVGKPTPHTRIPLNQGICGAAASNGRTVIVDDVNADPRYLACSLETRSE